LITTTIRIASFIVGQAWYDNEWSYSNRCVDLAIFIGNKMKDLGKQPSQKAAAKA
jgi:glyceraldehyde-3-phosphate dehydrogenase/erythrose-4-phosphate dehydrogenase